jgi:peptidoglycan/LPS O-acetylase OafA/YrhL
MSHGLTTFLGIRLFDATGAVWVFFAISGFLITIALSTKYTDGRNYLVHFYWNRVVRLYPSYWVWLILTMVAYLSIPADYWTFQTVREAGSLHSSGFWADHASTASATTLLVASVANITGFFADSLLSISFNRETGDLVSRGESPVWAMPFVFIGQYWTIGVELCFYAVAPLVTKSLFRITTLFFFSASGYFEQVWIAVGNWANLSEAFINLRAPKLFWMFMIGAMLGHAYLRSSQASKNLWAPIALLLSMYGYVALKGAHLFPLHAFPWWIFAVLTAALPALFAKTASHKLDRFAGELSYPVYINHFIVIQILGAAIGPNGFVFGSASVLLAIATVVLVERQTRRLKFEGSKRPGNSETNSSVEAGRSPA